MKHLLFVLCMALSATTFGQGTIINAPYTFTNWVKMPNLSAYSSGGYNKVVFNSTSDKLEYTSNTLLSGKVVAATEKDSARSYTHTGSYLTYIKIGTRDTISLPTTIYASNQIMKFVSIYAGADTTVFVPTSGTIDAAAYYTMTGTRNSVSIWFDGTNYWIIK